MLMAIVLILAKMTIQYRKHLNMFKNKHIELFY